MDPAVVAMLAPYLGGGVIGVVVSAVVTGVFALRGKRVDVVESARADLADTAQEMIDGLRSEMSGVREQWRLEVEQERRRRDIAEARAEAFIAYLDVYRAWVAEGAKPPPPPSTHLWGGGS